MVFPLFLNQSRRRSRASRGVLSAAAAAAALCPSLLLWLTHLTPSSLTRELGIIVLPAPRHPSPVTPFPPSLPTKGGDE